MLPTLDDVIQTHGLAKEVSATHLSCASWHSCQAVWHFMVEVNNAPVKRKFQARTDMSLQGFADIAYDCFKKPHDNVLMGYKFIGDPGGVTELSSELEWNNAMVHMKEKIRSVCTHLVTMELRNMVSDAGARYHKRTDRF